MNISNKLTILFLVLIIFLASFLRLYQLDQVPPALMWDEAAVGYNAWSIANFGKDEWGNSFPLAFKSFGEYKLPIHIYIDALVIKLFGLSDFTTRFPAALFGILNVLLIFFLSRTLFKNNFIGLAAALFLAISPYNLHFSRMNHEANIALFFFMMGLLFFYEGVNKVNYKFPISFIFFGISLISYNASKIFIPIFVFFLCALYWKKILKLKKLLIVSLIIIAFFSILIFINPGLSGGERASQTFFKENEIKDTQLYQITQNKFLGVSEVIVKKYLTHYSLNFLFISGDSNPRLGSQISGQFYKLDLVLLVLGFLFILNKRSKEGFILLIWVLLAPLPASITAESPHAGRAMYMMGSFSIISALGLYWLVNSTKKKYIQIALVLIVFAILAWEFKIYLNKYYTVFSKNYGIDWQYGMKQSIEYINEYPVFNQIYVTSERSQPYIFFLYYLHLPPDKLKETAIYNTGPHQSSNLILSFDNYHFGDWNVLESEPRRGNLYILTPSEYDGLKYKNQFQIMEEILYPNKTVAFYLVEGRN